MFNRRQELDGLQPHPSDSTGLNPSVPASSSRVDGYAGQDWHTMQPSVKMRFSGTDESPKHGVK